MTAERLSVDGLCPVEPMAGAEAMGAYLLTRQTSRGHVQGASVKTRRPGTVTCWALADILRAPHFLDYVLRMAPIAEAYLGPAALLYSLNAFTTFPSPAPLNRDIQVWHRDQDDVRFVALFVYLTDVFEADDGVHRFQAGTHTGAASGATLEVYGPAGTAFVADTRGLHLGVRPTRRPRTMAWARWGVSDPPASYRWDHIRPVDKGLLGDRYPADPATREALRLVVQ